MPGDPGRIDGNPGPTRPVADAVAAGGFTHVIERLEDGP